ncbi:Uncharacterised protein [Serratia fonticola]|uniref:Uncharacterized protein n=1 Tax=Serratia fonticola TaxID=47917 RepID=A0A448T0F0_SERFO|nr:Uncharacterised protein [Serratia fonticola]
MSTNITMIVPIKNPIAGVREVFTATGKGGAALMSAPVNNAPEGGRPRKPRLIHPWRQKIAARPRVFQRYLSRSRICSKSSLSCKTRMAMPNRSSSKNS